MPPLIIAPSILSANFGRLEDEIRKVETAEADWVHLDVMDGHYVPNITIGPVVVKGIREATQLPFDVHLMIEEPERYIKDFCEAGADRITVHQDATRHLHRVLQAIKSYSGREVKTGVALNPGQNYTNIPPSLILDGLVDMVLQMTVNPGFGGQQFLPGALDNIGYFRKYFPDLDLQVDGGISTTQDITQSSAYLAAKVGANILVAGSAVFKTDNYESAIIELRNAAEIGWKLRNQKIGFIRER